MASTTNPEKPPLGKQSWPELVGKNGDEAATIIERENTNVKATVLLEGSAVTLDYRIDRVRVFVNEQRVVTETPRVG